MTANQIANFGAQEQQRHNTISEEETQRHNTESENLQRQMNEITSVYNQNKIANEKWYNEKYIEYLNASEQDKVVLESELNRIREIQAEADRQYKTDMVIIGKHQKDIDEMYKTGMLELESENLDIKYKQQYYEGQKTEAYITDLDRQYTLAEKRYKAEVNRIEKEYELGAINASTRMAELQNAINSLQFSMTQYEQVGRSRGLSETALNEIRAKHETLNMALEGVKTGIEAIDALPW